VPSPQWTNIQRQLRTLGFDPGPIDGLSGPKTQKAVRAFQTHAKLKADGIFGRKTHLALFGKGQAIDFSVMNAARMIAAAYHLDSDDGLDGAAILEQDHDVRVVKQCPEPGVEAYMLNNGCLLIPGSNSLADYLRFNLRIWGLGRKKLSLREEAKTLDVSKGTTRGRSRTIWHQGFFLHAETIRAWIGPNALDWPKLIVGHSLGAASAQILSKTWATPAIGFAAPRPRKSRGRIALDRLSLSICRDDDIVCFLPSGFHRMGQTKSLVHKAPAAGSKHDMAAYIDALENRKPDLGIPADWSP
jgi:hypothetical protein